FPSLASPGRKAEAGLTLGRCAPARVRRRQGEVKGASYIIASAAPFRANRKRSEKGSGKDRKKKKGKKGSGSFIDKRNRVVILVECHDDCAAPTVVTFTTF